MRAISSLGAALLASLLPLGAALAQSRPGDLRDQTHEQQPAARLQPTAARAPGAAACAGRPALGVGRVLEIDTTGGPRFGNQQYPDNDILRDHEVVLTFDDGPLRHNTRQVLEALEAHCTRATFFMVGRQAQADPELVREIARRGHTVGTHTMTHANLRQIGASRAEVEIERGFSAVSRALGRPVAPFFRFPYLADSRAMTAHLAQRNLGIFSIDVDAVDYRAKEGATVHRNIMLGLKERHKGILLFHDIQGATAQGLRSVLDTLAAQGYKVVHLVPKAPATILARHDGEAPNVGAASTAAAGAPSGSRPGPASASQPNAAALPRPAARAPVEAFALKGTVPPPATAAPTIQAAPPQALPPVAPASAPPAQPQLRGTRDDDWRRRVFND